MRTKYFGQGKWSGRIGRSNFAGNKKNAASGAHNFVVRIWQQGELSHLAQFIERLPTYEIWSLSLIYGHPCSMDTNEAYDTKCRRAILNHFVQVGVSRNICHSNRLTVTTKCIFYCNYSSRFCFTHVYSSYCDTSSFVAQQLRDQLIIRGSHNRASS